MAENQNAADQASTLNDERATRLAKRAALFEAGQNPYPEHSELEDYVADIEAKYAELADGEDTEEVVKIAGRVMAKRGQGKIMFHRSCAIRLPIFSCSAASTHGRGCLRGAHAISTWATSWACWHLVMRTKRGQLSVAVDS